MWYICIRVDGWPLCSMHVCVCIFCFNKQSNFEKRSLGNAFLAYYAPYWARPMQHAVEIN